MSTPLITTVLTIARAAQDLGWFEPADWPDLAVELLLTGAEDPEVAELAALGPTTSGWQTDGLVAPLYGRHGVPVCTPDEAVAWLAATMAADLRARPAAVRGALVRALARVASTCGHESALADECLSVEEFLDCSCQPEPDDTWVRDLEALPGPGVPDPFVRILARRLRSTVPSHQPPHGHDGTAGAPEGSGH